MRTWEALALLLVASAILFSLAVWIIFRIRRDPRDRERRRRLSVNQYGRLGDATITEVAGDMIFFTYSLCGVVYTASQDVAQVREMLPQDPERLIGPVYMKYTPRNPANSIIVCEQWSGLRAGSRAAGL